jgi:hypothetical protein
LNFLKDRNLEIGQGFESKNFELKDLEYFKIDSKLNQGIWKFDEMNLNYDSEFSFKGKNFDILLDIRVGLGS